MDLSGVGDSPTVTGNPENQSYPKDAQQDVQAAMDYLAQMTGRKRFVIAGLCSGGDIAFQVAYQDARVAGAVLMNPRTFGVNDLGVYGRKEHHTPNLDRLAAEGLRFTTAYVASPICSPSRAAIMTGRFPARLHLTTFLPGRADAVSQKLLHPPMRQQLPLEEVTLAERLHAAGYATAMIGKWHLGGNGFSPREQGFDVLLMLEATIGLNEVEASAEEAEEVTDETDGPFTSSDLTFLKSLRISIDGTEEAPGLHPEA